MLALAQAVVTEAAVAQTRVDVVAVVGILGTLAGAGIGAGVALWVQGRQLSHENLTRFHDRRLSVYAEFNGACNKLISALASSAPPADATIFLQSSETLRLIASEPVMEAATRVHNTVTAARAAHTQPNVEMFNAQMAALCTAMRAEVGVASNSMRRPGR